MQYNLTKVLRIFERLSYARSSFTAFSDMLDFFLIPYRYHPSGEELQNAHEKMLADDRKDLYVNFFQELGNLCGEGFNDPLGEFYMAHISHGRLGQYFTPEPVCQMMVQSTIGDSAIPGQTVLDPACGSGRMLLAAAKINRSLLFYGSDLDPICCKMSVVNMLLNSMQGEVAHMNVLSNEFYRGYRLCTKLVEGFYYPYFVEFTEPEKSHIWLYPQPTPPKTDQPFTKPAISGSRLIQGSLF